MASYNEIAFMIYDELGLGSDDERFTIDHILFLMKGFRSLLLKQQYVDAKRDIPSSNYQTICIDIKTDIDCMTGSQTKSINKIPKLVNLDGVNNVTINPVNDLFKNLEWSFISNKRFKAIGYNKWLKNIIYFTLGTDSYLYLKSSNPNFQYINKVELNALFEDPEEASKYKCSSEEKNCNYLDTSFPLEENLIPLLIQLICKELTRPIYIPTDDTNNSSDDLSGLGTTK